MIHRILFSNILSQLKTFPAVGLIGPRQIGKTTLAKEIQSQIKGSIYLDLELFSDLQKLSDPELYLTQYQNNLVIIDEIQRKPDLFPLLRALIDQNRINGRFLILGSASPQLLRQNSESLAGRIVYLEMHPFLITELGFEMSKQLWLRGGYPLSYLAAEDDLSLKWRDAFVSTYLEKDIPQLGFSIPAIQLRRFWQMIAHCHGQLWNASNIAKSLGVSPPTVKHYLDILTDTFLVRQLTPYHNNLKKRLVKSPKIYLRDTGLLHALLSIMNFDSLIGNPIAGHSWEGFVIEQITSSLSKMHHCFFYRTSAGAEIDLLIVKGNKILPIEVKLSLTPTVNKGFKNAMTDLSCEKGYVIYPGKETYPLTRKIDAIPLLSFIQNVL